MAHHSVLVVALHRMAQSLVWLWWHLIRWRILLCNADGASSDGPASFLVVVALYQMAHHSVLLVALHRMAQSLVWLWWRFIRWRILLCNADGASTDGPASFLVVVTLSDGAPFCVAGGSSSDGTESCLVVVAPHQMAHPLLWCWSFFIMWHTISSDACGASSGGASSFLVLMALHWMAKSCVVLVALHQMTHLIFCWWRWLSIRRRKALLGGGGALSGGTHFCLALVTLLSVMAT